MASAQIPGRKAVVYPDSDGKPMAENTLQFRWIVTIQGGLDALFRDDPAVFVAGDLLWYPVEGDNKTRVAPDSMVIFGRPKGYRGSYRQWEEGGIAPQVVFEVLSPGNRSREMQAKLRFYERFGVEEYYIYDPDNVSIDGWLRSGEALREIPELDGLVSPRLGVRFDMSGDELRLLGPDGHPFATYLELAEQRDQLADQNHQLADQNDLLAAQNDRLTRQRDEERRRIERLEARLRELGEPSE